MIQVQTLCSTQSTYLQQEQKVTDLHNKLVFILIDINCIGPSQQESTFYVLLSKAIIVTTNQYHIIFHFQMNL